MEKNTQTPHLNITINKSYISWVFRAVLFALALFFLIHTGNLETTSIWLNGVFSSNGNIAYFVSYHLQLTIIAIIVLNFSSQVLFKVLRGINYYLILSIFSVGFYALFISNMSLGGVGILQLFQSMPVFFTLIGVNMLLSTAVCAFVHKHKQMKLQKNA